MLNIIINDEYRSHFGSRQFLIYLSKSLIKMYQEGLNTFSDELRTVCIRYSLSGEIIFNENINKKLNLKEFFMKNIILPFQLLDCVFMCKENIIHNETIEQLYLEYNMDNILNINLVVITHPFVKIIKEYLIYKDNIEKIADFEREYYNIGNISIIQFIDNIVDFEDMRQICKIFLHIALADDKECIILFNFLEDNLQIFDKSRIENNFMIHLRIILEKKFTLRNITLQPYISISEEDYATFFEDDTKYDDIDINNDDILKIISFLFLKNILSLQKILNILDILIGVKISIFSCDMTTINPPNTDSEIHSIINFLNLIKTEMYKQNENKLSYFITKLNLMRHAGCEYYSESTNKLLYDVIKSFE